MKGLDRSLTVHAKNAKNTVTMPASFVRTPPSLQLRGHIGGVRDLVLFETMGGEESAGGSGSAGGAFFIVTVSTDSDMRVWSECHFNLVGGARGGAATV